MRTLTYRVGADKGAAERAVPPADQQAQDAMCLLARDGVVSRESGAAGTGGLIALLNRDCAQATRAALDLTPRSTVLVISTEGATDPEAYARIVQVGADHA